MPRAAMAASGAVAPNAIDEATQRCRHRKLNLRRMLSRARPQRVFLRRRWDGEACLRRLPRSPAPFDVRFPPRHRQPTVRSVDRRGRRADLLLLLVMLAGKRTPRRKRRVAVT